MGTCISRCDCSCTRSSPVLPQQQHQELTQPTIQDKLVILSSSPLPSTCPLADHSSFSSPVKPPPPSSPYLSSTPSTNTTSNRSSSISCTSSTLSNAHASSSSSFSTTSTYTSSSSVSSELGRSSSDEFQWSNVRKHPPKPQRTTQPAPSQRQQKAPPPPPPPVPHKKPPPSWHRVAPTNTSSCPQLQKSFRKDQRISSSTRTTSERECVGTSVDDEGKARCSRNNSCNAKTHNRRPDGGNKMKQRKEKVMQKKTESRVHHMLDAPALLADQIVDGRGSNHRYCPGEDSDNSLVALDCFIFL